MRGTLSFLWEVSKIIIIALAIVIPIRYFLFQPFIVRGASMEPNFHSGDYLIVDEISYRLWEPQRGDVIVFKYPKKPSQRYIKRIIGLPGETIEIKDGQISVLKDGKIQEIDESSYLPDHQTTQGEISEKLGEGDYFVLGDNRSFSSDSRYWGFLPKKYIIGKALLRAWPLESVEKIAAPAY